MLGLLLWYYGVFLESFAQQRRLRQDWALEWNLPLVSMILAYAPVGCVAGLRIWFDRGRLDFRAGFLVTCFLVSFMLAKHEWFIKAHQPLHFTRGYVWMPLCLLALPVLQRWLLHVRSWLPAPFSLLLLGLLFAMAVSDNLGFLSVQWRKSQAGLGHYLGTTEREMFQWMDSRGLDKVLLCPDPRLSYLSATYTSVRPYYGHYFNTPDYQQRKKQVDTWISSDQEPRDMGQIDHMLLRKDQVPLWGRRPGWESLHENGEWILLQRVVEAP
jgi:hypothetical protein